MLKKQDETESASSVQPAVESRVSFKSVDGAVTLAGTLPIPSAGRGAPAAILIRSLALLARGRLQRDSEYERLVSDRTALVGMARRSEAPEHYLQALEIAARLAPRIFTERTAVILGAKSLSEAEFLRLLSSPCLETCLRWDPSRVVPLVTCPVLAVYASRDV